MDRRSLLASLAAAGAAPLAGCAAGASDGTPADAARTSTPGASTPAATRTPTDVPVASLGIPADVCSEPIQSDPGIYAITEPAAAAGWAGHGIDPLYRAPDDERPPTAGLADDRIVIGLARGDRARAYPLAVLRVHEVVNDRLGGPALVTYCPLCRSGLVAERVVDGTATRFGVSGLLWKPPREYAAASGARGDVFGADSEGETDLRHNGNLLMYDEATRSYWSQVLAEAICGPRRGASLSIRPSTVATWGEWRDAHPGTDVLLPPPHSAVAEPPIG